MKPSPRHFGGRAVFQFRGLEWPEPRLGERGEIQERGPEWRFSPLPKIWPEIKQAKGMARRIKQNQHWAGVCAGMAMAQVYIEPITLKSGAAVEGPADRREPFKFFGPPPGGGTGWGAGGGRGAAAAKTKKKKPGKAKKKEKKKETDR